MRILLFSPQIMNALNYARGFSTIDHQFIIMPLVPSHKKKEYELVFSQFDDINSSNILFSPMFLKAPDERFRNFLNPSILLHDFRAIFGALTKYNPDVVIGKYAIHAYPLALLKKLFNYSLFVIVSGGDLELHEGLIWRMIRKFVYSNSKVIFTVADRLKREIKEESGYDALVIPTGTDPNFFKPINDSYLRKKYGYGKDDFIILTLSQLIERKCIDDVIKAFNALKNKKYNNLNNNLKMIIAGDGPEKAKLQKLSSELNLTRDIFFPGFVSKTEKLELLNIADVYVIASYQEGLPFSLIEAMSCGCICIASNVGDIPNVIDDGVNGFLITPQEPEMLSRKIEEVMNLLKQQISLIKSHARRTIMKRFNFKKLTKKMIDTIEKYAI